MTNLTLDATTEGRLTAAGMVALVDDWERFVRNRVLPHEVDDVMQAAREVVLNSASKHDPRRGEPGAFVFGVVRMTVKATIRRRLEHWQRTTILDSHVENTTITAATSRQDDPLAFLIENRDVIEWATLVTEAVSPFEWHVVLAFVETEGTSSEVADLLGVAASTVRSARGRVATLTHTARAALQARDDDVDIVLAHCLPPEGGFKEALAVLELDENAAATLLGISKPRLRMRRSLLTRMDEIVRQVSLGH